MTAREHLDAILELVEDVGWTMGEYTDTVGRLHSKLLDARDHAEAARDDAA